ncbi:MAG: HAD-IIB family hydrolase [Sideroxydans sp.]|nr:HAD-IIB family hydrolase [Sideroxydans sp.]
MKKILIITDLDGTLLDEATYAFDQALPALRHAKTHNIPLILCSSKTRAEIEVYRTQLGNSHPFISENGGGIFIPHGYFAAPVEGTTLDGYHVITLGMPYAEVRQRFIALREQLNVAARGFGDMTVDEVASLTGLDQEAAALAMQREFDEPFVFDTEPDERFLQAIEAAGLRWTQGRIFHIMGRHHKGRAFTMLKELYQRQYGTVSSIGLGDSLNDLPLLMAVDQPVLVRHEDGSCDTRIDIPYLLKTQQAGPAGWNEAVLQLLSGGSVGKASPVARHQQDLADIFNAALVAVDPYAAVLNSVHREQDILHAAGGTYPLAGFDRIVLLGAGKSAARMALAMEQLLGDRISAGLIITKYGHALQDGTIRQLEAAHPVPDAAGMAATQQLLQLAQAADERTLAICLLSGGASALLVAPAAGMTLQDKQQATGLLLRAGASIAELNAVRKHLSAVKGGRLAQAIYPARLLTLILSDVIGDRLDVIASGPTAADNSTFADALAVISKYGLQADMPPRVMQYLQHGMSGQITETVKSGDPCLRTTRNTIIGGINQALSVAADKARSLDYRTEIITSELQGEARAAAQMLAQRARAALPLLRPGEQHCLICGGETTVTVRGTGKGGRNQELALAFAIEMENVAGVSLLSAGTDGSDGPTDAAGGMVDGNTAAQARSLGIVPEQYLDNNDSYAFFRQLDALSGSSSHFITGPTGTNVMDIQIMLLSGPHKEVRP